jgi:mRNA-degrading endonuclease RelE of RelBE toxin-antitoxin system
MNTTNHLPEVPESPPWTVKFSGKAKKQKAKLPKKQVEALLILTVELEQEGPEQPEWSHYGKLTGKKDVYHCHLNKGNPTYVAVWKVVDKGIKLMEVRYVGTHENADYRRID